MKRSIFSVSLLSHMALALALLLLLFLFSSRALGDSIRAGQDEHLQHMALAFRAAAADHLGDAATLSRLVGELGRQTGARITVVDLDGRVAADSESDPRRMENHGDRPEIIASLRGQTGRSTRFSSTLGQPMRYCAIPLQNGDRITGVLRVALPERTISHLVYRLRSRLSLAVGLLLLLALMLALASARSLAAPIRLLAVASERLAGGESGARVRLRGSREITQLAENFNLMVDRLEGTIAELTRHRQQLHAVLDSIREGLLVLDGEGRVTLFNDSLCRILDCTAPANRPYWEVTREEPFHRLLARALEEKRDLEGDIDLGGRNFQAIFRYLPHDGHLVITLHDVTGFRSLEKIKRDFLTNFSHELRTPLTAIKGYADTLAEEGPAADPAYIDTIRRHTDRLIAIVGDMLALSELEEKTLAPAWENVQLGEITASVLRLFEKRAREKGIALTVHLPPDLPPFRGEPERIEQLLINLVDNALKYTERGEIRVAAEAHGSEIVLSVRDSGPGIPVRDRERIFERFFVVDKSRARQVGGSGLGLSIVKHIVQRHRGRVEVRGEWGEGAEFVVTLPVDQPAATPQP